MRVKEMYPLCCISLESSEIGDDNSPDQIATTTTTLSRSCSIPDMRSDVIASGWPSSGSDSGHGNTSSFAGVVHKWTNYGKGWRSRWFVLRNGVVSYSKILLPENLAPGDDVRFIGDVSSSRLKRLNSCGSRRISKPQKSVGVVHLKISSFRESRSDSRRFYIFTATKTLHLRTSSKEERVAWIEALSSARNQFSVRRLNDKLSVVPTDISLSTERLKQRLVEEGTSETLVKDCEQIMLSEFSEIQGQVKALCEERSSLLDTLRQLEVCGCDELNVPMNGEVNMGKYEFAKSLRKQPLTMAIYIDTEKEEWEKVLDIPYCMDLVPEGFGTEPIAEYGAYSKIPKDLRKQILTWLRKQPGYYEMLHLKNKKEKKEKERKEKEMKEKEMKKRKKKDDAEGSGSNF
ncbi:oxysterol-binding protein, PH domain-like protein [Artemisia annua]|uniref:Oxysterol-binding protein, PH domain-like protein n=1 Tax=Artemisia annua TaxID=35608 RepID=A0A2U1LBU7_ARTAN|nr:oxysterol-binding protein, PH domain-like protein [Artemisia annua]